MLSSLVPVDPLTTDDATYFARRATVTFGIDHAEPHTVPNQRVWEVWEQAQRDGWSAAEFRRAVDAFVMRQKFPTWTVADFFADPRPRVYGHAWYAEQTTAGRGAEVGRYVVERPNGEPQVVWGWRAECDGLLTEHRFSPQGNRPAPIAPTQTDGTPRPATGLHTMDAETRERWDAIKTDLRAGIQLDEERAKHERTISERTLDRRRIEQLDDENDGLRRQLAIMTERNAELAARLGIDTAPPEPHQPEAAHATHGDG